jgi:hypothetical protein
MLPDYPKIKNHARRLLLRWAREQAPTLSPLLDRVSRFRQHEGRSGELIRDDSTTAQFTYPLSSFEFAIPRELMKKFDLEGLRTAMLHVAKGLADMEEKTLVEKLSQAAESVGNNISAGGDLTPEIFLEAMKRIRFDFDPQTGNPKGLALLAHPANRPALERKMEEWHNNPDFLSRQREVIEEKREEWLARENCRKLVD